jgi:hypothetical protein
VEEISEKYFGKEKIFEIRLISTDYGSIIERKLKDFKESSITIQVTINQVL